MSEQFAKLTPSEHEILCCCAEEAGEIVQIVMKAMRHGLDSKHPFLQYAELNRVEIAKEIGQLFAVADMMVQLGVINVSEINFAKNRKWDKIGQFLHHISIDPNDQRATAIP